jgi:hypothetical protein
MEFKQEVEDKFKVSPLKNFKFPLNLSEDNVI